MAALACALLVSAAFVPGSWRLIPWCATVAITYLAPLVFIQGWRISPEHFVERYGLIIIIALGESVVAIGIGASGLPLDAGVITAALLGISVAASLWWSYFDWFVFVAQATLLEATGLRRAALARDVFAYLHGAMIAGIVLFAFGLETTLSHVGDPLAVVPALGLCGGLALYFLAHVALRIRIGGGLGRGRPVAAVLLLLLLPLTTVVPALAALSLAAVICAGVIIYEFARHRESRAWIRSRRGAFTTDELRTHGERTTA